MEGESITLSWALETLGLDWRADMGAARKAYRELSRRYHPDRVPDPGYQAEANRRFLKIRDAYEFLRKHPHLLRAPGGAKGRTPPPDGPRTPRDAELAELVRRYRERHGVRPSYLADLLAGWLDGAGAFGEAAVWILYFGLVAALFIWRFRYVPTN